MVKIEVDSNTLPYFKRLKVEGRQEELKKVTGKGGAKTKDVWKKRNAKREIKRS